MVDAPPLGRVFTLRRRPLLGDCAPSGRVRLDALARWLQDVAYTDVEDAGIARSGFWVLRRTRLHVARFPRFAEHCELRTFCSGIGRMWAERRTTVVLASSEQTLVEAVALWVHLDPVRRVPSSLTQTEIDLFAASANGRRVPARLHHPRPAAVDSAWDWSFRHTDTDLADHVNNAAYWEPLEDELIGRGNGEPTTIDAEVEFRAPAQPGPKRIVASGPRRWITDLDGEEIYASAVLAQPPATTGS